jgi:hypothetical protein
VKAYIGVIVGVFPITLVGVVPSHSVCGGEIVFPVTIEQLQSINREPDVEQVEPTVRT